MILYLFKLILILIFNIGINTYYINSGCNCCCCESKQADTGSGGGKSNSIVIEFNKDNNSINIDSKNLELSSKNMPGDIVHALFTNRTTFCELDEDKYNSFTTDREITFKNKPVKNTFVLFAVKTTSGEYYLGYCNNGDSVEDNGLFRGSMINQEIKILGNGCGLKNINSMFYGNTYLENIVFTNCFDTNKVTNMSFMFSGCVWLTSLNLSNFNTNNVKNMYCMFSGCSSLKELNLSNFNTSKGTDTSFIFFKCTALKAEKLICEDKKIKDALNAPVK